MEKESRFQHCSEMNRVVTGTLKFVTSVLEVFQLQGFELFISTKAYVLEQFMFRTFQTIGQVLYIFAMLFECPVFFFVHVPVEVQ